MKLTARQSEMFLKPPRRMRGQLMHVSDAGGCDSGGLLVQMTCAKCDHRSGWLSFDTVTEAKRGLPCPKCAALSAEANRDGSEE